MSSSSGRSSPDPSRPDERPVPPGEAARTMTRTTGAWVLVLMGYSSTTEWTVPSNSAQRPEGAGVREGPSVVAAVQVAGVQDPHDPVCARQLGARAPSRSALALNPYRPVDEALIPAGLRPPPRPSAPKSRPYRAAFRFPCLDFRLWTAERRWPGLIRSSGGRGPRAGRSAERTRRSPAARPGDA